MKRYMLDTNAISHLLKGHPNVARRVVAVPMASLCISVITEAEIRFGLAKRPKARRLRTAVEELLRRVSVMPWSSAVAERYGSVRAKLESKGRILGSLDMLIAAHALSLGMILVTNDAAFAQVKGLRLEDWTA